MTIPNSTVRQHLVDGQNIIALTTGPDVYQPLTETAYGWSVIKNVLAAKESRDGLVLADFGTGTGQFAVWAKDTYPEMTVKAYDNDPAVQKYVEENLVTHAGLAADAVELSIMDVADIPATEEFDAIISTPPYYADIVKTLATITHSHMDDPEAAVFGGYKGLEVQTVFLDKAVETLKPGGVILVVHARSAKDDINEMLVDRGFTNISYTQDPNESDLMPVVDAGFTLAYK
jgi:methylase of polypeptide subunit release factors